MKNTILSLALLLASFGASAGVIGFDDLPGDETQAVANGYQGFDWDNVGVIRADAYPGSGYETGTVSFANTAFNRDGAPAAISRAGGFNFVGAYFTSAWLEQEISFEGWRNGQLLFTTDVSYVIDTLAPQWVQLGWNGIDTLVIYNSSPTPWAMDDFTVPEPASLALFGAALAGLLVSRRRSSQA
ncbi:MULTISPECIES: PEP-CTERM sorting domain-containing protein [unclassified Massilia]|uniref:PEP-CTERM sorting domain-containing protein n=1 Tax=unclassified Massilia TaxID=2609279 RepID=UPI001B834090|nr:MULTISPECIES: PEP-CTERM sorting domain-containing protein [unclassified Massilia]MBQ5940212.1 PEP-CTERM sorting domain-containing protein [Massilia sp. AB1]MBQ5962792.1 PEP-CTERM sorting domain-containing protein [Massilia sp. ZL223]